MELRDLADETFVDFTAGGAGRAQSDEAFAAAGVAREVAFEATAVDLIARLVRQGLGISLLPAAFVPEVPGVCTVPIRDAPTRVEYLVWSRVRPAPPAAALLEALGAASESGGE